MHYAWQAGILLSIVSFSIKLAALAANAWADTLTPDTRHLKPKSLKTTESKT
jgi:hypothetical protein